MIKTSIMTTDTKTAKSIESKIISCRNTCLYLRISNKESGESGAIIKDKMHPSDKIFEKHPHFIMLPGSRLAGEREHILEFVRGSSACETLRSLIDEELKNPITASNHNSDVKIPTFIFEETENDKFAYRANRDLSPKSIIKDEMDYHSRIKTKREKDKERSSCDLAHIETILHYIKNDKSKLTKITRVPQGRVTVPNKTPKENIFKNRVNAARANHTWLDVSNCKDSGAGIVSKDDITKDAFTFPNYPDLDRCFFTFKRDTGKTSPHKNVKNVGAAYCLKNYLDNDPNQISRSMEQCIAEIGSMVKTIKAKRERSLPTSLRRDDVPSIGMSAL